MLVPPVAFWGEFEINTLADNSRPLPHVWPPGGVFWGLDPYYGGGWWPWWLCLILCLVKMIAISITVLSGTRPSTIALPLLLQCKLQNRSPGTTAGGPAICAW